MIVINIIDILIKFLINIIVIRYKSDYYFRK